MPTFRKDIHLGHDVAQIDTDDIVNGAITEDKMADDSVSTRALQDRCVTEPKLADDAVSNRTIRDKAVTEPKLADDSVSNRTIQPNAVDGSNIKPGSIGTQHLEDGAVTTPKIKDGAVTPAKLSGDVQRTIVLPPVNMLDRKYQGITDELYSMVRALQVGGVALSQKLGNREDIGISQKSLTEMIIRIWEKIGEMTGECYMGFTMKVEPTFVACEGSVRVHVTADSSGSISNFDYIKIYSNGVLKAEGMAVETFNAEFDIDDTSIIECVAVIAGRTFTKQEKVTKYMPFFIGSGQRYQDIMIEECLQDLEGTLEGSYDMTVRNTGDHIFIIIPASRKQEFRRADMNGLGLKIEIPMTASEYEGFVVYKSLNTYQAGTYNIDIDINS